VALTVRELVRLLSDPPEECQDLEVVTADEGPERFHNQREWVVRFPTIVFENFRAARAAVQESALA
jgi:hypothetical protein